MFTIDATTSYGQTAAVKSNNTRRTKNKELLVKQDGNGFMLRFTAFAMLASTFAYIGFKVFATGMPIVG